MLISSRSLMIKRIKVGKREMKKNRKEKKVSVSYKQAAKRIPVSCKLPFLL